MKKYGILLAVLLICLCSAGCGKQVTLMGVELDQIQSCKFYYNADEQKEVDVTTREGKKCLKLLCEYLEEKEYLLEETDHALSVSWSELDAYELEKMPYCDIWIQFKGEQKVSFAVDTGEENVVWHCDSLLFDADELQINYSRDKKFEGAAYMNYDKLQEEDFSGVFKYIEE